jgi:hypothetical protein
MIKAGLSVPQQPQRQAAAGMVEDGLSAPVM